MHSDNDIISSLDPLEYLPHHGAKNLMNTVLPSVSLWNVSGVSSRAVIIVEVDAARARRAAGLIIMPTTVKNYGLPLWKGTERKLKIHLHTHITFIYTSRNRDGLPSVEHSYFNYLC